MLSKLNESMDDAEKLTQLLYSFFDRRGIDVEIKEYDFDFEFNVDIKGIDLTKLNRILTTFTDLKASVLIEYSTEIEIYDSELTVFFDRNDIDSGPDMTKDEDDEDYNNELEGK